eukprot:PhF_6_TR40408/c2_g1_i1/m.60216
MGCCLSTTVSSFQGQNRDVPFNQNLVNFCAIRSTSLSIGPDSNGLSLSHTTTSNHSSTTSTCITLRSYGNSETLDEVGLDSEIQPSEVLREATEAVRKAMSVTPLELIVVAGIPMASFEEDGKIVDSERRGSTSERRRHRPNVREWIDTSLVEVRYDDHTATKDAWDAWNKIYSKPTIGGDTSTGDKACKDTLTEQQHRDSCDVPPHDIDDVEEKSSLLQEDEGECDHLISL